MFAPPSIAALAIFSNYDPKPNSCARIAVIASFPQLKHSVTYFITDPGGDVGAAKDELRRRRDRDEGFGLEHQREPTVKIATLVDHIEN